MNTITEAIKMLNKLDESVDKDFTFSDIILFDDVSVIDFDNDEDLDGAYATLDEDKEKVNKYIISKEEVQNILTKLKSVKYPLYFLSA